MRKGEALNTPILLQNIGAIFWGSVRQNIGRSHLSTSISAEPKLVSNEGAQSIERNCTQEVSKRAASVDGMTK